MISSPLGYVVNAFFEHINRQHDNGMIGCTDSHCRPFLVEPDEQRQGMSTKSGNYPCPCGKVLRHADSFRKHLRRVHGRRRRGGTSKARWLRPGEVKPRR